MESHATSELPFSCDPFWFPYAKLCVCGWIAFPLIGYSKALFLFLTILLPSLDSFLYPICLEIVPQRIHLVSCSVQRFQVLLRFLLRSFSLDCFWLLPCCAFIITRIFQLSIVFLKKILNFCNFFSLIGFVKIQRIRRLRRALRYSFPNSG